MMHETIQKLFFVPKLEAHFVFAVSNIALLYPCKARGVHCSVSRVPQVRNAQGTNYSISINIQCHGSHWSSLGNGGQ
jgi:hypothetical protein